MVSALNNACCGYWLPSAHAGGGGARARPPACQHTVAERAPQTLHHEKGWQEACKSTQRRDCVLQTVGAFVDCWWSEGARGRRATLLLLLLLLRLKAPPSTLPKWIQNGNVTACIVSRAPAACSQTLVYDSFKAHDQRCAQGFKRCHIQQEPWVGVCGIACRKATGTG